MMKDFPRNIESPWPSKAERAQERAMKREALLETAVRFFNLKGFHATSLDDVALALNVTKPTIYHYFSNKDEILFECVQRGLEAIRSAAETVETRGGTGMARLRALMRSYAICMTHDFCICITRTSDHELSPESRARFREMKREIDLTVRRVVMEGMRDGSIASGDPRLMTFTLTGSLNWVARWFDPKGGMSREEIADGVVATLINGLAPRTP